MSIAAYKQAIASTRGVLASVTTAQLDGPTPCAAWTVSDLINHIVGGQYSFAAVARGETFDNAAAPDYAHNDFVTTFDTGATAGVAAFSAEGAMERMMSVPLGALPGAFYILVATADTFVHGWDLAAATGQSTDLAPDLAEVLLVQARFAVQPEFRDPAAALLGPEQPAPPGCNAADRLAAFLGRRVVG